jgi:hypothetical protein
MPSELQRVQQQFTAHLRDPQTSACPADVLPRRMQAYRELLTNNVESAVSACFPVLRTLVGEERWQALVLDFFARHRCHSPIYRDIPAGFLAWLQQTPLADLRRELPFLDELAHYEWMELALDIQPDDIPARGVDPEGDLLAGVPVLNPLTRVLRYAWPVHRLGPDFRPAAPEPEPSRLVMTRNRAHAIRFLEINPLVERLLERLRDNQTLSGLAILNALALEFPAIPGEALLEGGTAALRELADRDIVLGIRTEPAEEPA